MIAVGLALSATTLSACSTEDEKRSRTVTPAEPEMLARVSAASRAAALPGTWSDAVSYANVAALREQLGLPADAPLEGAEANRLLFSFASRPLFLFAPMLWGDRPSLGALGTVLDDRRIDALASTSFSFAGPLASAIYRDDVLIVSSRQPFSEIAERLREHGFAETRRGFVATERTISAGEQRRVDLFDGIAFTAAADAGEDLIVFGGSQRAVGAAADGEGADLTPAAELAGRLPGSAKVAAGYESGCVQAFGLGEDAVPREGVAVAVVDGPAEPNRLIVSGLTFRGISDDAEVTFADASATGSEVTSAFTSTDQSNATRLSAEDAEVPYECP